MSKNLRRTGATILSAVPVFASLLPAAALANVAIPVLVAERAFAWALLPAVLAIETVALRNYLNVTTARAFKVALLANAVSSIPGLLFVYFSFQRTTYGHADHIGGLIFITIAFVLSWAIEHWILRWRLKDLDKRSVARAAFWANFASYLLLWTFYAGKIAKSYMVWEWGLIGDFAWLPEWAFGKINE